MLQLWTLGVAAVAAVASVIAAIITVFATSRRERVAWLRELQIKANEEFANVVEATMMYVVTGPPATALQEVRYNDLIAAANGVIPFVHDLSTKFQRLLHIGEPKTINAAQMLYEYVPNLAYGAVPLPGVVHEASLEQRKSAERAIMGLHVHMLYQMRRDIGLIRWWYVRLRWNLWKERKFQTYTKAGVCVADKKGENVDDVLTKWQVRRLTTDDLPVNIGGYRSATVTHHLAGGRIVERDVLSGMPQPQAMAIKSPRDPWRFGIVNNLDSEVQNRIVRDAIRLITGHVHAFQSELNPSLGLSLPDGARVWIWGGVTNNERKCFGSKRPKALRTPFQQIAEPVFPRPETDLSVQADGAPVPPRPPQPPSAGS